MPESLELIQQRALECYEGLKPQDKYQGWIVDQVADPDRPRRPLRADGAAGPRQGLAPGLPDLGRRPRLEAIGLGNRLASNPSEIVEALRRTPHGCDWLIDRWAMLADAAGDSSAWTDEQTRLAFDLLATPSAFRDGRKPWASPAPDGRRARPRRRPGRLRPPAGRRAEATPGGRAELDEVERRLAEADLTDGTDPEIRRIRRYESSLHRQIRGASPSSTTRRRTRSGLAHLNPSWTAEYEPIRPAASPSRRPRTRSPPRAGSPR